jgi:hypothetical protein
MAFSVTPSSRMRAAPRVTSTIIRTFADLKLAEADRLAEPAHHRHDAPLAADSRNSAS